MANLGLAARVKAKYKDNQDDYISMVGNLDIADEIKALNKVLMDISIKLYNNAHKGVNVSDFKELSERIDLDEDEMCIKNLIRICDFNGLIMNLGKFSDFVKQRKENNRIIGNLK